MYKRQDFYAMFNREPAGETVIHVCNDPACALAGSETVLKLSLIHISEPTRPY